MTSFPIVLIPPNILQARSTQPPTPAFSAIQPTPPASPELQTIPLPARRFNQGVILFDLAASIPFSLLIGKLTSIPVLDVWLFLLILIGLYVGYKVTSYPRRKRERDRQARKIEESNKERGKKYDDELGNHHLRLKQYEEDRKKYERDIADFLTPERVKQFQNDLIKQELQHTISYDGENGNNREGWCEPMFYRYLVRYFSNQRIRNRLWLEIPDYDHPYSPDFAYIDLSSGFHIDIEIDEPYAHTTRKPTHYLGMWKDENRNEFFLSKGWLIIRFAEEQVARYPDECCKFIAQIIYEVTGDSSFIDRTSQFGDLPRIQQWNEEEAESMESIDYRSTYNSVCDHDFLQRRQG